MDIDYARPGHITLSAGAELSGFVGEAIVETAAIPEAARTASSSGAMRFHGGTNTGSARDPNSAARQSRPAAISAAATEADRPLGYSLFLPLAAVRVTPAVLQHAGRGHAGQSSGQIRGRECWDYRQGNRPPARDPQQCRKLRGRGDRIVVAPPQRRDPARLAPAVKLGYQLGPIRGCSPCLRIRGGAALGIRPRRGGAVIARQ